MTETVENPSHTHTRTCVCVCMYIYTLCFSVKNAEQKALFDYSPANKPFLNSGFLKKKKNPYLKKNELGLATQKVFDCET